MRAQPCCPLLLTHCDARTFPALRIAHSEPAEGGGVGEAGGEAGGEGAGGRAETTKEAWQTKLKFDRILADVPCSGTASPFQKEAHAPPGTKRKPGS